MQCRHVIVYPEYARGVLGGRTRQKRRFKVYSVWTHVQEVDGRKAAAPVARRLRCTKVSTCSMLSNSFATVICAAKASDAFCEDTGSQNLLVPAVIAAAVFALSPLLAHASVSAPMVQQSQEEGLTIKFKASRDPGIRTAQEALVETWGYVTTQYLDTNFNGIDWQRDLQEELDLAAQAGSPEVVQKITAGMLKKLGDPFTRLIPPGTTGAFENAIEGQVVSVGFQLAEDGDGALRVSFVAEGSSAKERGVRVGDRLVSINQQPSSTLTKEQLAALLRTGADVKFERLDSTSNGLQQISLHLDAQPIETHPVQYVTLPGQAGKVGYIRLIVFSKNSPQDVEEALKVFKEEGVESVVLDLRDNVGGVVLAGYQVAQLLLPPNVGFCYVEDGRGASEDVRLVESRQVLTLPMAVLVNGGTASTAELIAGSLQDNQRATLVGEKTFGKGRTQRVIKLRDNGLLLLSNTVYSTPKHKSVDKVGLTPDVACKPEFTETTFWNSGEQGNSESFLEDPCIQLAVKNLSQ